MRLQHYHRVLWIDAVYINQQNTSERSQQVSMMCQIYSNTSRCLVYLGEEADGSDAAMKFLQGRNFPSPDTNKYAGAIRIFFRRLYFRRLWVIQELVLSREILVHCREITIPWRNISAKRWIDFLNFDVPLWIKDFHLFRYVIYIDLPRFLFQSFTLQAFDDRDKIFGLLRMLEGLDDARFVTDYGLSLP